MLRRLFTFQKKFAWLSFFTINLVFILWFCFILGVLSTNVLKSPIPAIPRPVVVAVISLLISLVLFGFYRLLEWKPARSILVHPYFPVGIFLFAVLTRWAWILLYGNINLDSDYALYMRLASALADTGQIPADSRWYVSFAPYVLGYSTFLAILLSIFGKALAVVHTANMLLSGYVAVILFFLGRKISGRSETGVIGSALWIGMPAVAGMTSLPETELPFIALLLTATYVSLHLTRLRSGWARYALFFLAAVLAVLMNEIRPLGLLVLVALVLYMFITSRYPGKAAIWRSAGVGMILLIYFLSSALLNGVKERFLGTEISRNSYGFGLYLGLNYDNNGSWNTEDAAYVDEATKKGISASDFHQRMIERSVQRFNSLVRQNRLLPLFYRKISTFWSHPNGFLDWISVLMEPNYRARILLSGFNQLSNYLYCVVILLCLVESLLSPLRKDYGSHSRAFFIKVMVFVYLIALTVFDNNYRYLVPVLPLFFLLAASGLQAALDVYRERRTMLVQSAVAHSR